MIFSRTSQYAIQAMIYLATQPSGQLVRGHVIARSLGIPTPYLNKVLHCLSRGQLVHSSRGRNGGFRLGSGAENNNLLDIALLTDGARVDRECLLGHKACNDETACLMHPEWKPVKKEILACLGSITLSHLAQAVQSGQYRLADLPRALTPQ
jgi:Rrf2 family iron-sulfur cluster assembly transcriptional regulator